MLVPLDWLRSLCDPAELTTEELAARMTMTGTKDERILRHGPPAHESFVVGRVVRVEPHPNADRLRVCAVDLGAAELAQIVCGAPNVAPGGLVAVAQPGAVMPDGTRLKAARLRGVESAGMILAEDEIGVGGGHAGIMKLAGDPAPGTPLHDVLEFGTDVIEFELTPNRPDCLGVYGIARELHASTGAPLAPAPWRTDPGSAGELASARVDVLCPELCPRFSARVFEAISVGESPLWLKARLSAAGQRPINNVVDVTNYVMLLTGQPLHAFDLDQVVGGTLTVRRARGAERMRTLDGVERTLDSECVVICDAQGPTSIAGIMGGARSEVSPASTRILLESATWVGANIQRTSTVLGLRSEASARFEKGLSPEAALEAQAVASALLIECCGARLLPGTIDLLAQPPAEPASLRLRPERVAALLGTEIPAARCREILRALDFDVDEQLRVRVPHFRRDDVTREVDLIEEVARIHGVDRLPATLPPRRGAAGRLNPPQRVARRAEDALAGRGLHEILGWSFASPELLERLELPEGHPMRAVVEIVNPMSGDQSIMRPTLLGSLLDVAGRNAARGRPDVALFESARVYRSQGEHHALGALLHGSMAPPAWTGPPPARAGFFTAKALLAAVLRHVEWSLTPALWPFLHPGRSAAVQVGERRLGLIGELHPRVAERWDLHTPVAFFAIDLGLLAAATPELRSHAGFSPLPSVREDLAMIVPDSVAADALLACVRRAGGDLLAEAQVFDVYAGEQIGSGRTSLALHLEFRAAGRTLTDDEVAARRGAIVAAVQSELGGELRG
ncbi:MAG: phenylalanine--tRNA ligase subunit beta [Solirubrobacteraceae bacterium]